MDEILDIHGVRLVVENKGDCFAALNEASGAHPQDVSSDEMSDEEYGSSDEAVVGKKRTNYVIGQGHAFLKAARVCGPRGAHRAEGILRVSRQSQPV
ncbi:hypothetical protein KSP40_PGU017954 [Platanthera guangdongensis]|uniref:Uncharacterized protein n=1 Tax=Platanthera guangdongensis TaxID=2320717 RepID=A0ABR2LDZ2_9ASPA